MNYDGVRVPEFCAHLVNMLAITPIVISPAIRGNVFLYSSAPIAHEEVFAFLKIVLKNNGAMLIGSSGRYQIVPVSQNMGLGWEVITGQPQPPTGSGIRRQHRSVKPEELESHVISRVDPILRQPAGQPKLTGKVGLEIALNEHGEVDFLYVSMPAMPPLDEAAFEAVKQWRFRPFIGADGLPEPVVGLLTIVFN
jgi:hypothetical protein